VAVHIGKLIQAEVENKGFTYREFGALINKSEKTVPNIYSRSTLSIDLLIIISGALKIDFFKVYYEEEPMKSLRLDQITKMNVEAEQINEENKHMQRELTLIQNLAESQKETISLAKDQLEEYKLKVKELSSKLASLLNEPSL
jgi:hypothetical protein